MTWHAYMCTQTHIGGSVHRQTNALATQKEGYCAKRRRMDDPNLTQPGCILPRTAGFFYEWVHCTSSNTQHKHMQIGVQFNGETFSPLNLRMANVHMFICEDTDFCALATPN